MADIKTRDTVKGTIKTIDKASIAGERMKQAYIATKDKAEHSVNANSNNADEYASEKMEQSIDKIAHDGAYLFDKAGRKGVEITKENYHNAKNGIQQFKQNRAEQSLRRQTTKTKSAIKTLNTAEKSIKQSVNSAGKKTIKAPIKVATNATQKSVKTAEKTAKTTIKTAKQKAKAVQRTAQKNKVAKKSKESAKKMTTKIIKGLYKSIKSSITFIISGGWIAVAIILIICLVGYLVSSVYGIFFCVEESDNGTTIKTAVQEINQDYENQIEKEKNSINYDILEMSGSKAAWKEVLAIYSVKVNTDKDNPMEVATMDDTKKQLLKDIFWEMNEITSRTETKTHNEIEESDDGHGNIVEIKTKITKKILYITVSHKPIDEMASRYGFNQEQKAFLTDLLKDENNPLWSQVLYGIGYSDGEIVTVALSQVGNVGGQPYWSWYGFNSRIEWCACFVSWCANECGYIEAGIIPKYADCVGGALWFKDNGQWEDKNFEPSPGTIIFFDWQGDGITDHTGIVEKCENGIVYTIEGNSKDTCKTKTYPIGSSVIYGYGIPAY